MKKIMALGLAGIMAFSLAACGGGGTAKSGDNSSDQSASGSAYDKLNLKISVATGETGIDYMTAQKFADLISEASDGQIKATVYASSQLTGGDMSKTIDVLLAGGTYEMCTASGAVLSNVEEKFLVHQLPFAFDSYQVADGYLDGTGGDYYAKLMNEKGMVQLGLFHNGMKQVTNSKKEIHLPSDFQGMKIRIPSGEVAMKTFQTFGADPIAMGWSEVYTALQQGTVDGHDNGYMTIDSASIQEVNKYITELNWQYECYALIANAKDFNSWNEATQELVKEKSREAAQWGRDYLENAEKEIKEKFIKEGVIITDLTDEEHQAFVDATADVRDYFIGKYGDEACKAWGLSK